jgi:hypothetical protein
VLIDTKPIEGKLQEIQPLAFEQGRRTTDESLFNSSILCVGSSGCGGKKRVRNGVSSSAILACIDGRHPQAAMNIRMARGPSYFRPCFGVL